MFLTYIYSIIFKVLMIGIIILINTHMITFLYASKDRLPFYLFFYPLYPLISIVSRKKHSFPWNFINSLPIQFHSFVNYCMFWVWWPCQIHVFVSLKYTCIYISFVFKNFVGHQRSRSKHIIAMNETSTLSNLVFIKIIVLLYKDSCGFK